LAGTPVLEATAAGSVIDAVLGRCPRCHARSLFAGMLSFAPACTKCGLDFTQFNVGDGATAFVTLIAGGFVVAGAITLQAMVAPPIWLQLLIWLPVTLVAVVGLLRVAKAALLGGEYRTGAREGRLQ
jgi:uncharacterized protein (DUF983 family)